MSSRNLRSLPARIGGALASAAAAGPPGARYLAWFAPLPLLAEPDETPLLGVMAALWLLWPDLQKEFPLDQRAARARYIGWCCTIGAKQFALLREAMRFGPARDVYWRPTRHVAHFGGRAVAAPFAVSALYGLEASDRAFDPAQAEGNARAVVNTPPPKGGGFGLRLKAGSIGPLGR